MGEWEDLRDVLYATDTETAKLIVRLQTEDAQALSLEYSTRGKTTARDTCIASDLYKTDLTQLQNDIPNRQLGEQLERQDNAEQEAFEVAAFGWKLKQWKGHVEQVPDPEPAVKVIACTSCANEFEPTDIMQAPCSHPYCCGCLEHLYDTSMVDETLFPPRCCHQEFPWDLAKQYLSQRCKSKFGTKRIELETKDRTYCHVPTCSAFITSDHIYGLFHAAHCPNCKAWTCFDCKGGFHFGKCPPDPALQLLNRAAEQGGWQRCVVCRRVLELKHGCNHMTCICKNEFCYVCGQKWKTCTCARWDEDRLIERATRNVDLGIAPVRNPGVERQEQVAQAAEHLRNNHECAHAAFRTYKAVGGYLECEICGTEYPNWIKQCKQCLMLMCVRCRHNRL